MTGFPAVNGLHPPLFMPWRAPGKLAHASPRSALLAVAWTCFLGWVISLHIPSSMKVPGEPPIVHSITLLKPDPVLAPESVRREKSSAIHGPAPASTGQITPSSTITVGKEVPQALNADAVPMRDTGRIVIDAHALRSAIQSRSVERLAQESGRPLINSKPTLQEKWHQSIQKAEVPDCLESNPNGMGLLNAPVLLFKAITDKCK